MAGADFRGHLIALADDGASLRDVEDRAVVVAVLVGRVAVHYDPDPLGELAGDRAYGLVVVLALVDHETVVHPSELWVGCACRVRGEEHRHP